MSEQSAAGVADGGVIIVECGSEGGSVSLQGRRDQNGHWVFWTVTDESSMAELMPDEFGAVELRRRSREVDTWAAALDAFGRYPWRRLYPVAVHPEFADAVLQAVQAGGAMQVGRYRMDRWLEVCHEAGSPERGGQP